ncbi:MAG TPA: ABC transporter substrate-binding protein [Mycobacteriales bacterium]|nr:ABC transporter substrate-binding protein [Mycobacteriales bacterium]
MGGTPNRRRRRAGACLATTVLAGTLLAACGGGQSSGPVTISFYDQPGSATATQANADACTKAANGRYKVKYIKLPTAADQQRLQLVRRMAAKDSSVDVMGLDVTWEAEFAEAGWAEPWTGENETKARADQLPGPLATAIWKNKLYAVPYNSNTQLLWYRSDLVPKAPKTWDEMISMAQKLKSEKKPYYIEEQGAQYEGATVWFNSMVASAGGSILNKDSTKVALNDSALTALQTMKKMATTVANPSLGTSQEGQAQLQFESGTSAFEINYPFVWSAMAADKPTVKDARTGKTVQLMSLFKYAPFPTLIDGKQARSTIGGIDLAISPFSKHKDLAFEAALCLANKKNQLVGATEGGLPPTLKSVYTDPPKDFVKLYPFYKLIYQQLKNAAVRPKTPAYQSVSIAISHSISPMNKIDPPKTLSSLKSQIADALASKGLVP